MKRRASRGFTLVELLIVIVVIAILAAITIVAYGNVTSRARLSAAEQFESDLHHRYGVDEVGDWSFDDCSGSTVQDSATSSADTISGTVSWITDTPTGKGCALHFDGTTHIETQVALGSALYVKAAWVRIADGASCSSYNIISQAATSGANAAFYVPSSCHVDGGNDGVWNVVNSPGTMNDGQWHYVALIWQASDSSVTLYVDGVQQDRATSTSGTAAPSPNGYIAIGSHGGGNKMVGDIDDPFVATE